MTKGNHFKKDSAEFRHRKLTWKILKKSQISLVLQNMKISPGFNEYGPKGLSNLSDFLDSISTKLYLCCF